MLLTCMFYFAGHFRLSSHSNVSGPAQENKRKQSQLIIQVGSIYSSTPPYSLTRPLGRRNQYLNFSSENKSR
ncbi:hypothetical protein QYF36_021600 [Acer negundo]|nr:hypothetical protein QYF36_021600 [Acer negundo]